MQNFSRIVAGVMSWGEWGSNFKPKAALQLIEQCVESGITTFDHADIYGHYTTEALFGEAIKRRPTLRQKMQLVSKCGIKLITPNRPEHRIKSYDTSKAHIIASAERSLKNLRTSYLDMLLIHRPSPLMQPQEIAAAFYELKASGKVREFGVSNFTPTQFAMLNEYIPLQANQLKISLLHLDPFTDGTLDQCLQHQAMPMAYNSLAGGQFFTQPVSPRVKRIRKVAKSLQKKYNATLDQIITAWLLQHPANILPVMGSVKIERLQSAVAATKINMTREEWFMLLQVSTGEEVA